MAYGRIKADTLVFDNSGSDVELTISTIALAGSLSNYAPLAGATFTGGIAGTTANFTGNVGIGTTSPSAKVHITNNSNSSTQYLNSDADLLINANGTKGVSLKLTNGGSSTESAIVFDQSATLKFTAREYERMRIDSSGKVGIGTSSPGKLLSLQNSNTPALGFYTGSTLRAEVNATSAETSILSYANSPITLNVGGSAESEALRIDSSGNVGIGNTSPSSYNSDGRNLVVGTSGGQGITIVSGGYGNLYFANGTSGDAKYRGMVAYYHPDDAMQFRTAATERMRIDSSGNVGIGTTSPYSASGYNSLTLDGSTGTQIRFRSNGAEKGLIYNTSTEFQIYGMAGIPLVFQAGGSERMRLDSSGRLLVGSSVVQAHANMDDLQLGDGSGNRGLTISSGTSGFGTLAFGDSSDASGNDRYSGSVEYYHADNSMRFYANIVERMRIEADGMMRVRGTATSGALNVFTGQSAASNINLILGQHSSSSVTNGTLSFLVLSNGNVQNTNNSYGAISDSKLKENIVDAGSQWDDFKAVRFRKYNFKKETGHETFTQLGVIAQELELISPGLVTNSPDLDEDGNDLETTTKGIKYSILTTKALVALQEAMERIETLEAEVKALKAG